MKKIFLMMFFALFTIGAMAENGNYPVKNNVEVNSFWSNWFLTLDGGAQISDHSTASTPSKYFNSLGWECVTPTATFTIGKWVTPIMGIRGQFNFGHYSTVSKCDYDANTQLGGSAFVDAMFNLSNLFSYKDNRFWNFVPFVGYGRVATQEDWKHYGHWGWNAGIDNQFRLADRVRLDFEVFARRYNGYNVAGQFNNAQPKNWNVGAQVGVALEIGKNTWKHAANVAAINALHEAQVDALNDAIRRAYLDRDSAYKAAASANHTVEVVKVVEVEKPKAYSVFFSGDSYKLESRKDLVNLQGFVDYANSKDDAKLVVTGYADSKTGSVSYNQELSEKRAETIKNELVKAGVPEEKIVVRALGGVYDLNPYNYNRRVVVTTD